MISARPENRCDVGELDDLQEGLALFGGEPRTPMLYAQSEADVPGIVERWQRRFSDRARLWTKEQAVEQGLFGEVDNRVAAMLGDVIVSASDTTTIVDSRSQSDKATRLPSVHGSQSLMEMDIPCLIDMA
jgi:hypothetical protein